MIVAYKYRANPNPQQVDSLETHFQIHANLYNKTLETLNEGDEWISKYSMHKRLTDWKKNDDNSFDEINSKAAQQTVNRIYRAISGLSELSKKARKLVVSDIETRSQASNTTNRASKSKTNMCICTGLVMYQSPNTEKFLVKSKA